MSDLRCTRRRLLQGQKDNYGFPPKLLKVSCHLQLSDLLVFYIFASNGGL